eukprot:719988_1
MRLPFNYCFPFNVLFPGSNLVYVCSDKPSIALPECCNIDNAPSFFCSKTFESFDFGSEVSLNVFLRDFGAKMVGVRMVDRLGLTACPFGILLNTIKYII